MDTGKSREERQREREVEPPAPLSPDATDPREDDPHHALNNPAEGANPTEFPDPYERRPDPRDPDADAREGDEEGAGAPTPRPQSTSEPPPPRNYDDLKPVKGDTPG